ncbi:MAG: pteridine reductase [Amphritea sp.]
MNAPVALVTGAARRIGATIAQHLHKQGYRVIVHYNNSAEAAHRLADELNSQQADTAQALQADLNNSQQVNSLAENVIKVWGRLDLLINNASSFFPTPLEKSSENQWNELINSNLKAPYFLCSSLAQELRSNQGAIINLIDIHAQRALPGYPIYSIAKAGLQMLTLSLAKELAPQVRVNGVSPGPILWPEDAAALNEIEKEKIVDKTLLKRVGHPKDIAETVCFLANQHFITGQIIAVDGGKSLYSA